MAAVEAVRPSSSAEQVIRAFDPPQAAGGWCRRLRPGSRWAVAHLMFGPNLDALDKPIEGSLSGVDGSSRASFKCAG